MAAPTWNSKHVIHREIVTADQKTRNTIITAIARDRNLLSANSPKNPEETASSLLW